VSASSPWVKILATGDILRLSIQSEIVSVLFDAAAIRQCSIETKRPSGIKEHIWPATLPYLAVHSVNLMGATLQIPAEVRADLDAVSRQDAVIPFSQHE
jgi:hypothetical protein